MPDYTISVFETLVHTVKVSADNDGEALALAYEIVENGDPDSYTTISDGTYDSNIDEVN
jgi:hypothetical protein